MGNSWEKLLSPADMPEEYGKPANDPMLGMPGRKERVMIATEAELRACLIPRDQWDYCAHRLLEIERCKADNFPFIWKCRDEVAGMNKCLYDDHILRMKEYEREKRLIQRKKQVKAEVQAA